MKAIAIVAVLMFVGACAFGMSFLKPDARITIDGKLNSPCISHNGGRAYLQVSVKMSDLRPADRRPVNVAVVVDRSGSMADEQKIDYAKAALLALIAQLQSDDIFSLVIYDQDVDVLRPAKRVGSDKRYLRELVEEEIYPRGSTNLGGGMIEGFRQVERNAGLEYVNRVILLSDGLANQGIVDPRELRRIADQHTDNGISLTTMGVGLAYNENLMLGLSQSGGGNYYFIESAHGLTAMLEKELNCLSTVIAQNAFIELTLGRGVRVNDVIGCENSRNGNIHTIHLGDLYSNERREITVELDIPDGSGSFRVAEGTVKFERGKVRVGRVEPFSVSVRYTRDVAVIEMNRDMDAQAKADVALSTRRVDRAMQLLDDGKREEAVVELQAARSALSASPAATAGGVVSEAVLSQEAKLQSFGKELDQNKDNAAKAKKSIQYENYRVQKKK